MLNAAELIAESLGTRSDGMEMIDPEDEEGYEQHPFDVAHSHISYQDSVDGDMNMLMLNGQPPSHSAMGHYKDLNIGNSNIPTSSNIASSGKQSIQ
jgi:hypothetical protein